MVSPPKNVKSQQQSDKYRYLRKKNAEPSVIRGGVKGGVSRERKPYSGKTIYLDLKNITESARLQASLKALGAEIAVFLDRTVTHVVTDRPEKNRSVPSPAASASPLPTPSPTSERSSLPRSRGAALLESIPQFYSNSSSLVFGDPLHLANRWNIPVLSNFALWRDIASFEVDRKPQKKQKPKGHFLKIEPVSGNRKPDLLKLNNWPEINLDCPVGHSPFQWCDSVVLEIMTRRLLKNSVSSEEDSTGVSISTKAPQLCNGHGPSTRHSHEDLKVQCNGLITNHRSSKLLSPSGSDVLPLGSQRRATRRASASWCGSTRELSQLSPTDSELGVSLRPKATLWLPAALVGTTAEENGNTIRRRTTGDDVRPKKKKLSPEEKLLQDNKEYFKMEVLNTKLRSSGSLISVSKEASPPQISKIILKKVKDKSRRNKWTKTKELDCLDDDVDYEALIVENKIMKMNGVTKKPKRPRQSELMKLCDEAESFMFGESSRQRSISESTTQDTSQDSICSEENKLRKRRSQTEAFINDNMDYYKFEAPNTRLRSQDESENASMDIKTVKEEPAEWRTVVFSFQTVPHTEPWFSVYTRQDDGKEMHFPTISDPSNQPFLLPYELPRPVYVRTDPSDYYAQRRKRIAQIIAQNLPRKSPRCHASTLAILSSLKKRKRKSSTTETEQSPKKQEEDSLGLYSDDEVEPLPLVDPDDPEPNRRRKKTDDRLVLKYLEPEPVIETSRQSQPTMNVVDLIEAFREEISDPIVLPDDFHQVKPERGPQRRKKKSRKFNKTGWDKAKVRRGKQAPRNTGIAQENVLTSPRRPRDSPEIHETSPCLVRVRKLKVRSDGDFLCRKIVFTKRKRSVTEYSWTTRRR